MAYTTWPAMSPMGERLEPVATIQSPFLALRRMRGLQIASVQSPQKGLGAAPSSYGMHAVWWSPRQMSGKPSCNVYVDRPGSEGDFLWLVSTSPGGDSISHLCSSPRTMVISLETI